MAIAKPTNNPRSRQEAVLAKTDRYFTGLPCAKGHVAERITASRVCVDCRSIYSARYRTKHPAKVKVYRDTYNADYYLKNKDRVAEQRKQYRASNKADIGERKRAYYELNKGAVLAKAKTRYLENRDRVVAAAIAWAKANRDKRRAYNNNRRALKNKSPGSFTAKDIKRIYAMQRAKCAICRCSIRRAFHIDHIVALVKDGTNLPKNLQLLCPPCNMKKHDADPIDYMQSLGYLL